MKGIGSHQSARMNTDVWLTPPSIIKTLGPFDLDPCAPEIRPWDTARRHYTKKQDGLSMPWCGYVWMNPPYGKDTHIWMNRLASHGNGIALIFARTETDMFVESVWKKASSILFIHGRLYFHHEDGSKAKENSGAPSVLVGYGPIADRRLKHCGIEGTFIQLKAANDNKGGI